MQKKTWGIKAYCISVIAIAFVFIAIPYLLFENHPIYTTFHIYIGVISFLTLLRYKDYWFLEPNSTFDKVLTILIWVIAPPVFLSLGLISIFIILCMPRSIYSVMRIFCTTIVFIFGIRIRIFGNSPKEQAIFIANHCSTIDDAFNLFFMVVKFKVLFAPEVTRLPFAQFFLKRIGIPIDRKSKESRVSSMLKVYRSLKAGFDILIYPEGRRLPSDDREHYLKVREGYRTTVFGPDNLPHEIQFMLPFEDGAFELSMKTKKPIQPIVMSWTYLFKPRSGQWWFSPRTIDIYRLGLVQAEEEETLEKFKMRVWNLMVSKLKESLGVIEECVKE